MKNIIKQLEAALRYVNGLPRIMKIWIPVSYIVIAVIFSSCTIGASPEFVKQQKVNAELVFPIFDAILEDASKETIAKVLKSENISDEIALEYKEELRMKLDSWLYLINSEVQIVEGLENE